MNLYAMTPHFFVNIQTHQLNTISAIFLLLCMIALVILLFTLKKQTGKGICCSWCTVCLLCVFVASLLLLSKGFSMTAIKGFLLFLILLQASISDIKTRQVPDCLSAMILLTAFIQAELIDLPAMLLSLLVVGLPQLIIAVVKPGTYGGADIKITASSAFLLGLWKGLFAIIIGLLAGIFIPCIVRLIKKQSLKEGIPMIPYLSFGILLAFII